MALHYYLNSNYINNINMKKTIFLFGIISLLVINNSCERDFATIYGVVKDSEGVYIKGADVRLSPSGGAGNYTTEADGKYEFNQLDPQQYKVTVYKTGYKTEYETVDALPNSRIVRNFTLTKKP